MRACRYFGHAGPPALNLAKLSAEEPGIELRRDTLRCSALVFLRRPPLALAVGLCVFEIAFYFAYTYGMGFTSTRASPFWIPSSILLCALLYSPRRYWWIFLLAPLPIRLFMGISPEHPLWFVLGAYVVDSAQGLAAALVLRRILPDPFRLESFRDLGWFALVAVLTVPAVGAFAGAGLRHVWGASFWPAWSQWFMGDALAQIVITPAVLNWVFWNFEATERPNLARALEIAVTYGGLVAASYLAFQQQNSALPSFGPLFYLPVPFLYWTAIRFGMAGASIAVPVFVLFSLNAAAAGGGPFAGYPPEQMTLVLQSFLLFRVLPVYLVAVLIEQRNSTKRSLHESEARFRVMANSAPVLIWESGLDKVCAFFNSRWLEFTGRSLEQEIGNGWLEGIHPDDVAMCLESYSSAFDARCPFEIEYRLRRHDGEYRWIEDRGVPRYDSNGEFCGFIGSGIDISERKQAETNNAYLAHMQRLVLVGELSATIAHEVRQPLQAITLHANTGAMLLSSSTPALGELREIVAEIEEDARRADDVIDRIRNFLGRRDPAMETLDMNAIVTEVARLVSDEARKRRVDVRLRLSGTVLQVLGDRTEIMQVLLNLILNGMDAMETGVEAERRLTLQTERHAALVRVSVRDRGTGISPERMKHLFDPFFTTKSGGMGLGLSIAKSIIYRHSGRIWADNNPDTGATFYFELPVLDTN